MLPGKGGIHRVMNDGESTAISVHLYGPRMEGIDGRDYDPSRDHVCTGWLRFGVRYAREERRRACRDTWRGQRTEDSAR